MEDLIDELFNITPFFCALKVESNVTTFALCQLSRDSQRESKQPVLQDLRDSGEIEQSARKVIMLYNKDLKTAKPVNEVDLIVEKNDNGLRFEMTFNFNKMQQKFIELN